MTSTNFVKVVEEVVPILLIHCEVDYGIEAGIEVKQKFNQLPQIRKPRSVGNPSSDD
jgi:hypothetical protein